MERDLLTVLAVRENYERYARYVDRSALSDVAGGIVDALGKFFDNKPDADKVDWSSFRAYYLIILDPKMSETRKSLVKRVIDELEAHTPDLESVSELVTSFITRSACDEIVELITTNGQTYPLAKLEEIITDAIERSSDASGDEEEEAMDLTALMAGLVSGGGVPFALTELQESIGVFRPSEMYIIGGRPESGKTSFALDVFARALFEHDPAAKVLFLNNEEDGNKIRLRLYNSVLNLSSVAIGRDVPKNQAAYNAIVGDRFIVEDNHHITTSRVEKLCKEHEPKLLIFNVLDKVAGFEKSSHNEVDRIRRIAQWSRGLAKRFNCTVVCVAQADAAAEGERYFDQSKLYGSKTGLPGEADVILNLGKTFDTREAALRFVTVAKNKTPGTSGTDPEKKHSKFVCTFTGETGRFTDATLTASGAGF